MKAQLIIVKLNSVARNGNEFQGPHTVEKEKDIRPEVEKHLAETLQGVAGYVLFKYKGKIYQVERTNIEPPNVQCPNCFYTYTPRDPEKKTAKCPQCREKFEIKPYVFNRLAYHPLATNFTL